MRPLSVQLWSLQNVSSVGAASEFHCRVLGSRPAAVVTWWLGRNELEPFFQEDSRSGNDTFTVLLHVPTVEEDGETVRCEATHPSIPDFRLDSRWILDVHCEWISLLDRETSLLLFDDTR